MILKEYQDAFILDKPSGVSTHTPDAGMTPGFLEMAGQILGYPLWAVHRLDRDTSGSILVAKRADAVNKWTQVLTSGIKKYVFLSTQESEESVWNIEGRIEKVASHRFGLVDGEPNSHTTFAKIGKCSLGFIYEAEISTGKTHQIRIHAQKAGIPILGDASYGGSPFVRLMLHAKELQLGNDRIQSPLPTLFSAKKNETTDIYKFLASLDRRRFLINYEGDATNAWRLVHREWSKNTEPKLCIEKLGEVLQFLNYTSEPLDLEFLQKVATLSHCPHWFVRQMKNRGKGGPEDTNILQASPELPLQWQVLENKIRFDLRHNQGMSSGLFLDQRSNRARILHNSNGKKVANFFSYTCGFSVAAALGGAEEVVSVDISPVYIEWGKNNFRLNGLDPQKYEFFTAEALFFLNACVKRGRLFNTIILDPPTFARHKHGTFQLSEDLDKLLELSFKCLAPGGEILVSLNDERISSEELGRRIEKISHSILGKVIQLQKFYPPYDFEFPLERETVLKGFWITT